MCDAGGCVNDGWVGREAWSREVLGRWETVSGGYIDVSSNWLSDGQITRLGW